MSIQDRIASLNLQHVRSPADAKPPPPKPPTSKPSLPPRPPPRSNLSSASTQNIHVRAEDGQQEVGNQPARATTAPAPPQRKEKARLPLPPPRQITHEAYQGRSNNSEAPPPLPSRGDSSQALARRESNESIGSTLSARSSVSGVSTRTSATTPVLGSRTSQFRVPSYDPSSLPALPAKRSDKQDSRPALRASASSSNVTATKLSQRPPVDIPPLPPPRRESSPLPPPRPARRESRQSTPQPQEEERVPSLPSRPNIREVKAPPAPRRSALAFGMNKEGAEPSAPAEKPDMNGTPPPIPTASRPNLAALQASKPKPPFTGSRATTAAPAGVCLICRDFSAPDQHAARFPRENVPNDVAWLAESLTSPFESHTDKARALFTWSHHNIDYNAHDFLNGSVKPSTPQSTLETGLAVCEGYASLFNAMALAVGLESVVIGGHGMGFRKKPIGPNDPTPPEDASGHAWNVVKIDNNEWKLIDVCWGAGGLGDDGNYHRGFHPERFTQSNDDFGLDHFPKDPSHQFRNDGRFMDWDEYIRGPLQGEEKLTVYSGCQDDHGIAEKSFQPRGKFIRIRGANGTQRIQFMFGKVCQHWDSVKMGKGKPYQYVLAVGGRDGRNRKNVPFRTNGQHWWLDIELRELGAVGQSVHLYSVTSVGGEDGRGLTYEQYQAAVGRKGMGFGGVACWQLA